MMVQYAGRIIFWALWPVWMVYFRITLPRARVAIQYNNEILLVKGWMSSGKWELPGGGAHPKETIQNAAVREVYEELGIQLDPKHVTILGERVISQKGLKVRGVLVGAKIYSKPQLKLQKFEITATRWAPIQELGQYTDDEFVAAIRQLL